MLLKKLATAVHRPWRVVASEKLKRLAWIVPDQPYLECCYRTAVGKKLDLRNPVTYTEKLQWLKLHDRRSVYTQMVDKAAAKEFVRSRVGDAYIIPTLGIYDSFDEIDFDALPDQFVIKCTHDSAGLVICRDKAAFDRNAARRKICRCLKRNFFYSGREWPYKNVPPRIIVEAYMEDSNDGELRDYKFFTFGGEPRILYITQGRGTDADACADFFDMDFNHLDLRIDHEMAPVLPHPPANFEKMKELAAELSEGTPQLRVDFYEVNGQIYFGEMTFFHCSGYATFRPECWDELLGSWVELPAPTE